MARIYVVKAGDTLGKIAKRFYGDASLYKRLAEFNGITSPSKILVGERIELPPLSELETGRRAPPEIAHAVPPPHGLRAILRTFGNINSYIGTDGKLKSSFESRYLGRTRLPFAIPLAWSPSTSVTRLYCHKLVGPIFRTVFQTITTEGLGPEITGYGGCFNFRSKRTSGKISTHSWGIAIDLNPRTNQQGTSGDMHPGIIEIFRRNGFKWGGDWTGRSKDPMHFQYCTGY